jgi:CRP-like cAMP-binding protein/anti-sigma regulatory factor (Ser/Thr protein kinase)
MANLKPARSPADNYGPVRGRARNEDPVDPAAARGKRQGGLSLRLPARPAQAALLRAHLRLWLVGQGADDDEIVDILLAANEAFGNALVHARQPRTIAVHVDASVSDGIVELIVRDHGRWQEGQPGFDEAGLGLHLMPALMDDVDIQTTVEGTAVRLRRVLRSSSLRLGANGTAPRRGRLELLGGSPIFAPQSAAMRERLAARLVPLSASPDETIIHEGDHGEVVYLVSRGRLQVRAESRYVATLGPGDHLGEIALLHNVPRTATIVAQEQVELYALARDDFLSAVGGHNASRRAAETLVATRIAGLQDALGHVPRAFA